MPGPYGPNPRRRCGCYRARWAHNRICGKRDPRNLEGTAYRSTEPVKCAHAYLEMDATCAICGKTMQELYGLEARR